ncbi:hypothetical protein [Mycolicibacterium vinylchloridicum]|uniref:hypothetical protein n=1 Tax=Mycolicibacterium vinylchloridicum TaxID=2736928 RepID=UPI0015CABF27|nr:hypothetical protein [Mycolicibacterium vinylchloridicum]
MNFMDQTQRSSFAALAAMSAVAAISVTAFAAGPSGSTLAARLAALPVGVSSAIHDVLVEAHTAIHADRGEIAADRNTIRATRHDAAHAIGASVLTGDIGEGQIVAIVDGARSAVQDEREAVGESRGDIRQTRQAAAADIRTIIAGNHDGSTVQDVKAILDTAKMDNATTRSAIVADAQENKSIRHTTTSDAVAIRQSVRAGEISKQEAAQEIQAGRSSAHAEIADNHAQMATSHKDIKATRHQAAKDVATTVHQGRTGE